MTLLDFLDKHADGCAVLVLAVLATFIIYAWIREVGRGA